MYVYTYTYEYTQVSFVLGFVGLGLTHSDTYARITRARMHTHTPHTGWFRVGSEITITHTLCVVYAFTCMQKCVFTSGLGLGLGVLLHVGLVLAHTHTHTHTITQSHDN